MTYLVGGDFGGRSAPAPAITVTPSVPAYSQPYFPHQVGNSQDSIMDIDELINAYYQTHHESSRFGLDPYLTNLQYIKDHPPAKGPMKEWSTNDILNGILDVIGYGSAFASFLPYAPIKIGGMLGYSATNAGRAFLNGNSQAGLRYLNQLARGFNRTMGYYGSDSSKMGYSNPYRRIRW